MLIKVGNWCQQVLTQSDNFIKIRLPVGEFRIEVLLLYFGFAALLLLLVPFLIHLREEKLNSENLG